MANLDELYGACITPEYVGPHEYIKQKTWLMLDDEGVSRLKGLIEYMKSDGYLGSYLSDEFTTLWLIDAQGKIRIAIEEMVLQESPVFVCAPKPTVQVRWPSKLGHPALVEGGAARIGGELSLNRHEGVCYLSNKSGRFGVMRTEQELRSAAELFKTIGIEVTAAFQPQVVQ